MKNKITALVSILTLSLTACLSTTQRIEPTQVPTLRSTLVSQVKAAEEFTCWTTPGTQAAQEIPLDSGHLLIAYGDTHRQSLYRFDFSTGSYSLLLTDAEYHDRIYPPTTSPDGQYLWYSIWNPPPISDTVHIYQLADGTIRNVPFPSKWKLSVPQESINWSADGQCLILWQQDTAAAYRLADGAMQQKVFPGVLFNSQVSPSPDGRKWAWSCKFDLCIMHLNDETPAAQIDKMTGPFYRGSRLRWSPDSQTLAFAYSVEESSYGRTNRIRFVQFENDQAVSYQDILATGVTNLQWSPDGTQLLIFRDSEPPEVYTITTKTFQTYSASHGYADFVPPIWSPSGQQIAYAAKDNHSIYVMKADGTDIKKIPSPPYSHSDPLARVYYIFWVP